jgi:hypothetical protein
MATYDYLKTEIARLCELEWAKQPADFHVHGKRWKTSFYDGCCRTISERLSENLQRLSDDNAGTAIVLVNKQKEVDDFVKQNHSLRESNASRSVDGSGFAAGREAGKTLNLGPRNKQLAA